MPKRIPAAVAEGFLFTDQYQLTMAQVYFRHGLHRTRVQFEHIFREYPHYGSHQAGYCINAGLETLVERLRSVRFTAVDRDCLRSQLRPDGTPMFSADFLDWLEVEGSFESLSLQAVPEGRVIHAHVPVNVVQGPLAVAQILETALLNQANYQILVATKASRLSASGRGRPLLEFGCRRGQGSGANLAVRAALIGGCDYSSNVGASHALGVPPKGTHAHSLVQLFMALGGTELDAFQAYAETYPDNCILLVDTVDTLQSGVPNAIRVFERLRAKGHTPTGVRLDSGDLAYLSVQVARQLDAAGFPDACIVLSSDLDELVLWQILEQIAQEAPRYGIRPEAILRRLVYGVGTRLVTSWGSPALGGVYKLVAVQHPGGAWAPALKRSDTPAKTVNPGLKHAWRLYDRRGKATADLLSLREEDIPQTDPIELHHPLEANTARTIHRADLSAIEPLLVDVLREGRLVYELPGLDAMRRQRLADLERLDDGVKRPINPHVYHVSLTPRLWRLKQTLSGTGLPPASGNAPAAAEPAARTASP